MAACAWKASLSDRSLPNIRNDVQGDWLTATYGKSETSPGGEVRDLPTRARVVNRQCSIGVTIGGPLSIAAFRRRQAHGDGRERSPNFSK
jgi:hypothetical protein